MELYDLEVKYVYADNSSTKLFDFDVIVNCDVSVKRWSDSDDGEIRNRWLRIKCCGELDAGIKNFKVKQVLQYEKGSNNEFKPPLSDALVPLVWKKDLDKVASSFLKFYYPQALEFPQAINPSLLVQKMGLTLEKRKLTEDTSIFGQIYFQDIPSKSIKTGTVLIDSELENIRYQGVINNTIIHECVHWVMHRKVFELERVTQEELTHLSTVALLEDSRIKSNATDWMEWQTESLTPKIMMPKEMFRQEARIIIKKLIEKSESKDELEFIQSAIDELAVYFGVSRLSAKIRLVELGFDIAIGAFNYIDGKYVPTHYWKQGFLEQNQTFSISIFDIGLQLLINPELKKNIEKGSLLFVENHFCLNDSKYISYNILSKPFLTPYARHHMDECCIVFEITAKVQTGNQTLALSLVLNRDVGSDIKHSISYPTGKNNEILDKAHLIFQNNDDVQKVLKDIPKDFGSALDYLIKFREFSNKKLISELEYYSEEELVTPLSVESLSRLIHNDSNPKLKTVVMLCIGLQLPMVLCLDLIKKAGFELRYYIPEEMFYLTIIACCGEYSLKEWNNLMIEKGCQPFVKN